MRKLSYICTQKTVIVAQLVRASDCGSEGRGFETHHSPKKVHFKSVLFLWIIVSIIYIKKASLEMLVFGDFIVKLRRQNLLYKICF